MTILYLVIMIKKEIYKNRVHYYSKLYAMSKYIFQKVCYYKIMWIYMLFIMLIEVEFANILLFLTYKMAITYG